MREAGELHLRRDGARGRTRLGQRCLAVVGTVVALLVMAGPADAHRNDESYLYLDVGTTALSGRVEMPYPDLRAVFGYRLSGSAEEIRAEVAENLAELQQYAAAETSIGADGVEWELRFEGFDLLEDRSVGPDGFGYVILPFEAVVPVAEVPQVLDVRFTAFLEEIPDRNNIALVANDWQRGVFDEETNELLIIDAGSPEGTIDLGNPSQWRNFTGSIDLGVDHIRTGPDHIFFILVLLLPSVFVLAGLRWYPSPSFRYSLVRVVIVATMFTLAHSVTFTLAGLDLFPLPPSKLVESLIALSIAAAALHNLRPVLGHREWAIAFAFGLFHGMGFAGLVEDLGVNRTTQLVSLLGRNVGIEIGQLVIIAISFPGLFLLRRTRVYQPFFVVSSLVLAGLSGIWVVERVFEVDAGVNDLIDKVIKWPRSFWLMAGFTAVAAVLHVWERRRGRLLEAGSPSTAPTEEAEPALV